MPTPENIEAELLDDAPCGFLATDTKGKIIYSNATLARWLKQDPIWLVSNARISDILTSESNLYYETQVSPMMHLQGFAREISCRLQVADRKNTLPVLMNVVLRNADEKSSKRLDFAFFDITERVQFDLQLQKARSEAEELAAIVRNATVGILRCDSDGYIKRMNATAANLFSVDADTIPSEPVDQILKFDADGESWFQGALKDIKQSGSDYSIEAANNNAYFHISVAEISDPFEPFAPPEYSIILRNITQRVLSEKRLNLLIGEMGHRSKNLFAVINGLVRQTLKDMPRERDVLTARLLNLSASQDILTANHWETASLSEIMEMVREQVGDEDAIRIDGPEVQLEPNQFKALSMAMHELLTNARKYGALSVDTGLITINWTLNGSAGEELELVWRETGGPAVTKPDKRGFGSVMIEQMLAAEFGGSAETDYVPTGIVFTCRGVVKAKR